MLSFPFEFSLKNYFHFDRKKITTINQLPKPDTTNEDNQKSAYAIQVGARVKELRELFKASPREFSWRFKITVTDLESYEKGEKETPRDLLEELIQKYKIEPKFLDGLSEYPFQGIIHRTEEIIEYLKQGFKITIVTPPAGHSDRSWLLARTLLFKHDENIPYCFLTSGIGSFKSTHGGKLTIVDVITAIRKANYGMWHPPSVLMADEQSWNAMENGRFYKREAFFGPGSADYECHDILSVWNEKWF